MPSLLHLLLLLLLLLATAPLQALAASAKASPDETMLAAARRMQAARGGSAVGGKPPHERYSNGDLAVLLVELSDDAPSDDGDDIVKGWNGAPPPIPHTRTRNHNLTITAAVFEGEAIKARGFWSHQDKRAVVTDKGGRVLHTMRVLLAQEHVDHVILDSQKYTASKVAELLGKRTHKRKDEL